jgi:hypothetical protein
VFPWIRREEFRYLLAGVLVRHFEVISPGWISRHDGISALALRPQTTWTTMTQPGEKSPLFPQSAAEAVNIGDWALFTRKPIIEKVSPLAQNHHFCGLFCELASGRTIGTTLNNQSFSPFFHRSLFRTRRLALPLYVMEVPTQKRLAA